eukprot:11282948-Alexandrium_andersonii.AAC.1
MRPFGATGTCRISTRGPHGKPAQTPASGVGHRSPATGVLTESAGAHPAASRQGEHALSQPVAAHPVL